MNRTLSAVIAFAGLVGATHAAADITLYGRPDFMGPYAASDRPVPNLEHFGFNDRASSAIVDMGRWQVCDDVRFRGHCTVLQPGEYPDLESIGLDRRISSVRLIGQDRYGYGYGAGNERNRPAFVDDQYRRRNSERLFTVPVTSVRAVVTQGYKQRCWVERQQVQNGGNADVAGAVVGGIIGGIIGHQFGGGRGNDVATGAGAVGGALLGANVARNNAGGTTTQDVQRCQQVRNDDPPDYWDVTYNFRGVEHHVQMTAPPGDTITVNGTGEPRV